MRLFVFLMMALAPIAGMAAWERNEIKDEMRGSSFWSITQSANPIGGYGPRLDLFVIDRSNGSPGMLIQINNDRIDGCPSKTASCKVSVKFGSGEVREESVATKDGTYLVPSDSAAFISAMSESEFVYIELALSDGGRVQYKLNGAGLNVNQNAPPEVSVMGYRLGEVGDASPSLELSAESNGVKCYAKDSPTNILAVGDKAKRISLCFFNQKLYSVFIKYSSIDGAKSGAKYLDKVLGPREKDSYFPSWPDNKGKSINDSVRRAIYFRNGKEAPDIIITDEAVTRLVPDHDFSKK